MIRKLDLFGTVEMGQLMNLKTVNIFMMSMMILILYINDVLCC